MSETFLRDIMGRDWRGNVRELRSYLEHAVVLSDAGVRDEPVVEVQARRTPGSSSSEPIVSLQAVVEQAERTHIRRALSECESSVGKTAQLLGISRKTLWEKMKRLSISA